MHDFIDISELPHPFNENEFLSEDSSFSNYSLNSSVSDIEPIVPEIPKRKVTMEQISPNKKKSSLSTMRTSILPPPQRFTSPNKMATSTSYLNLSPPKGKHLERKETAMTIMNSTDPETAFAKRRLQMQVQVPTNKEIMQSISTFYAAKPKFYDEQIEFGPVKKVDASICRLLVDRHWNEWSAGIVNKFTHHSTLAIDLINELKLFLMNQEKTFNKHRKEQEIKYKAEIDRMRQDEEVRLSIVRGTFLTNAKANNENSQKILRRKDRNKYNRGSRQSKFSSSTKTLPRSKESSKFSFTGMIPGLKTMENVKCEKKGSDGQRQSIVETGKTSLIASLKGNTGLYFGQTDILGQRVFKKVSEKMSEKTFTTRDLKAARTYLLRTNISNVTELGVKLTASAITKSKNDNLINELVDNIYDNGMLAEWKKTERERAGIVQPSELATKLYTDSLYNPFDSIEVLPTKSSERLNTNS